MLLLGCSSRAREETTPPQGGDALFGVAVKERRPGAPAWILKAQTLEFRGDTLRVHPVRIWFLSPRGDTHRLQFLCHQGHHNRRGGRPGLA
ncbi:MAG: hypothetical protein L3J76_01390 [Candidatus Hydrothermae bacterium]|nr:hypothetical protein [Candidatus Hydrothermae bacterium]